MTVDIYSDCKFMTPPAWSWHSRSLEQLHAGQQSRKHEEADNEFSDFEPTAIDLHYRDPIHYAEMLLVNGSMEREKLREVLQNCLRLSSLSTTPIRTTLSPSMFALQVHKK